MKTSPGVSIALATRNGARFIAEQLDSIGRQTTLPAELIVCDDASSDQTLAIVAAFAASAPFPVRVERNAEPLGYKANFMKAAGLCRSDLIAFSDQDDVWRPQKLKTCCAAFGDKDVLLTYHDATVVTAALEPIASLGRTFAPRHALNPPRSIGPWRYGLGFTLMFRHRLLDFSDLWPQSSDFHNAGEREAHDQWFFFLASCLGSIGYIKEPLVLYRQHGANTYGWKGRGEGIRVKLHNLLSAAPPDLRPHEIASAKRAAILEQIGKTLPEPHCRQIHLAAIVYRKLETGYRRRRETVYAPTGSLSKLYQIAALSLQGGYRSTLQGGAGGRALVRDILRGVVFFARNTAGQQ